MANINEEDLEPMSFEDIALDIDDKAQLAKDIYDNDDDEDAVKIIEQNDKTILRKFNFCIILVFKQNKETKLVNLNH